MVGGEGEGKVGDTKSNERENLLTRSLLAEGGVLTLFAVRDITHL